MHKHGKTSAGKQRWFCTACRLSETRKNPAVRQCQWRLAFVRWLKDARKLAAVAKELGVSLSTLRRRFEPFLRDIPALPTPTTPAACLSLDGYWLRKGKGAKSGKSEVVLIALDGETPVAFAFAGSESHAAWRDFLAPLPTPRLVVTDGNTGLLRALRELWCDVPHQRCLVHVSRETRACLYGSGNGEEARELRALGAALPKIRTVAQARQWRRKFARWGERNRGALAERAEGIDRLGRRYQRRYTRRGLRAAYAHLRRALPTMFTYLQSKNGWHTTNYLEGAINKELRRLIRCHCGMPRRRQKAIIAHILILKHAEKSHTI